jgi:hypothetical protein
VTIVFARISRSRSLFHVEQYPLSTYETDFAAVA